MPRWIAVKSPQPVMDGVAAKGEDLQRKARAEGNALIVLTTECTEKKVQRTQS